MATKKTTPEVKAPETEEQAAVQPEANDAMAAKDAEIAELKAKLQRARPDLRSDYERVKAACEEAAASGVDPWTVEIEVMVPHREKTEDPWYWINVNGQAVQIPANDRFQAVKLPWADVLVETLRSEKRVLDYQDSLEVYDPVFNPHK